MQCSPHYAVCTVHDKSCTLYCALHQGCCLRHESRGHGLLRPRAQGGLRLHLWHKDARARQVTATSSGTQIQFLPKQIQFLTKQIQFLPTQIQFLTTQIQFLPTPNSSLLGTEWSLPPASWRRGPGRCWRPTTEGPNSLAVMTQFDVTQHNHNKPDKYMQQTVFGSRFMIKHFLQRFVIAHL